MVASNGVRPRSSPRVWLTGQFALLSLIPLVLLGLLLGKSIDNIVQTRFTQTQGAASATELNALVPEFLRGMNPRTGLPPTDIRAINALLHQLPGHPAGDPTLWAPGGLVAYSVDQRLIGRHTVVPAEVKAAFRSGTVQTALVTRAPAAAGIRGPAVAEAIPLRQGSNLIGVYTAYSSFAAMGTSLQRGTRQVDLFLGLGLAGLWLLLFPIVVSASRRLRRQAAENVELALRDPLTGLPNRNLFHQRFAEAVADAERRGGRVGLLLIDLDRFKEVNDSLGHAHGDRLLTEIGQRLLRNLRLEDTLARLGGDEFAVIVPGVDGEDEVLEISARLLAPLDELLVVDEVSVLPQASAGIALFPEHGRGAEQLLSRADVAMYAAKEKRSGVEIYSSEIDRNSPGRLQLVGELRQALKDGQVVCHYQPLVSVPDGRTFGMEALVRWEHPTRGTLAPAAFLLLAEQAGLMSALTECVLDTAIAQWGRWRDAGYDVTVAVNLAPVSLQDPAFPGTVEHKLSRAGMPADRLELEITESSLLLDPEQAEAILNRLSDTGVRITLDDFGTGFSSLAYLARLPVGKIKIDRSFVTTMDTNDTNRQIVDALLDLGSRLGIRVLAEGVETGAVWDVLAAAGCGQAQGYFVSRPLPQDEASRWLASSWQCPSAETPTSEPAVLAVGVGG